MNTRSLKKELKYKIPQLKLALIREGKAETFQISSPDDIQHYAEPLKHMSDFVPKLNMCPRCRQGRLWLAEPVCCGT